MATALTGTRRRRAPRMERAERGRQLLDVAEEVFGTVGFQAASVEEIAARAGVTKPVIYDHFDSKDGLFAAVLARGGAELQAATAAAVAAAPSPRAALEGGLAAYFTFIARHAPTWSVLTNEAAAAGAAAGTVERIRGAQVQLIAAVVDRELPGDPVSAALYAEMVVGAAERMAQIRHRRPELAVAAIVEKMTDLLWGGFATLPRAGTDPATETGGS